MKLTWAPFPFSPGRDRPTAADCLSHSWLQQGELTLLCSPEEICCSSELPGHTAKCSEEWSAKPSCNGSCSDKEDKENIPEDSSTLSKRFRFDNSLQYPQDFVTDFVCWCDTQTFHEINSASSVPVVKRRVLACQFVQIIGILEMHFDSFMLVPPFLSIAGSGFRSWGIGVVAPIKWIIFFKKI